MDIFEAKKVWLHRKGTPYVWEFEWDESSMVLVHHARKHTYQIRYCRYIGFYVSRVMRDKQGRIIGHTQDHKTPRPKEIEFEHGGRYVFPKI